MVVEEVRLQIIHTQFQRPQSLTDECLRSIEGRDERVHEHVQVGEEGAQSHWYRQTQLHKQVLHVRLVLTTLKSVQTWRGGGGVRGI